MAMGRCSGCQRVSPERKIRSHIITCAQYQKLFQLDPERCLDPAAEFRRYRARECSPEARADQRDVRLRVRFADINQQQASSTARWATPPDILD